MACGANVPRSPRPQKRGRCSVGLGVDPVLRVAEPAPGATGPQRNDLGEDRERRLRLRFGADVEPARTGDPHELRLVDTLLEEPLAAALLVTARAERPDVERLRRQARLQGR